MATGQNNYARRFLSQKERLLSFVKDPAASGCWLWSGKASADGYGCFSIKGKKVRAHRASWEIFNGPLETGMVVCHKCDVRLCVRPDHLFIGTVKDNVHDMHAKRRNADIHGPRNPMAKLSPDDVRAIRSSDEKGFVLASRFNVSQATVSLIRRGLLWSQ